MAEIKCVQESQQHESDTDRRDNSGFIIVLLLLTLLFSDAWAKSYHWC